MNRQDDSRPPSTRDRLVDAALDCLRTGGLAGASARAITGRAGANLGAIGYHFGSKEALVCEALLEAVDRWLGPVLEELQAPGDPLERTTRVVSALRSALREAAPLLPVYFQALVAAPHVPGLRAGISERLGRVRSLLAADVSELKQIGAVPAWAEPDAVAALQVALANGLALHVVLEGDAFDVDAVASQFVLLLLAAGQPPSRPSP